MGKAARSPGKALPVTIVGPTQPSREEIERKLGNRISGCGSGKSVLEKANIPLVQRIVYDLLIGSICLSSVMLNRAAFFQVWISGSNDHCS